MWRSFRGRSPSRVSWSRRGSADLGIAYPPDVLREVALGSSLKIVAAIIQENNVALVVPADSPYQTAADLDAAESYGGYGTPHERPLVTEMLTAAGAATPGDFQEVVLQGGAIEALIGDRVDFSAVFQGWSEIAARLRGTELRLFPYVDFIPEIVYPDVVFIARSEMIEQQPGVLERALKALGDAYTFAAENPDEAAEILISEVTDLQQSEALVRERRPIPGTPVPQRRWDLGLCPGVALRGHRWSAGTVRCPLERGRPGGCGTRVLRIRNQRAATWLLIPPPRLRSRNRASWAETW